MNLDKINAIRYAVCGIGYLKVPEEEFLKDPMLDPFEVMGTGFLIGSGLVLTAAHVLDDLKEKLRKRPEPFEKMVQFGYPQADQWRVEYRSFREFEVNDRADWATIEVGPVGETVRRSSPSGATTNCASKKRSACAATPTDPSCSGKVEPSIGLGPFFSAATSPRSLRTTGCGLKRCS